MKTAIIYVSIHHGNTEKIAKEIANILEAKLLKAEEANPESLWEFDLLGFGSGIYYGKHHKNLLRLIHASPIMQRKKAFVFSTAGVSDRLIEKNLHTNHQTIRDALAGKKFDIIGEFSCCGFMTWAYYRLLGGRNKGRPNPDDLRRARIFAENLREEMQMNQAQLAAQAK
jgi:flavodoxin